MTEALKLHGPAYERLMSEDEAVDFLNLTSRPNPKGALRWLMRTRKLAYMKVARGVYGFRTSDLAAFTESNRVPAAQGKRGRRTAKLRESEPAP